MSKLWTGRIDPGAPSVPVRVLLAAPLGRVVNLDLILDTGTPVTIVSASLAASVDLTADMSTGRSRLWGPTGPQDGYVVPASAVTLLGQTLNGVSVHCQDLDPNLEVDGVVGLDLLRQGELILHLSEGRLQFTWD